MVGCVMPGAKAMKRPLKVRRADCNYLIDGPFVEVMRITGEVGVDGDGRVLSMTVSRCLGAGGSAILFHPSEPNRILVECMLYSKVPGNQAVCRAKAWALHNVIDVWPGVSQ